MDAQAWATAAAIMTALVSGYWSYRVSREGSRGSVEATRVGNEGALQNKAVESLVENAKEVPVLRDRVSRLESALGKRDALVDLLVHELWQTRAQVIDAGKTPSPLSPMLSQYLTDIVSIDE